MPVTNYKVLRWGSSIGHGVSHAQFVQVSGVAKTNSPEEPNIVASEFIAARLGQAILLPIPPAFIVDRDGEPWFASLDFNLAGETLPPVTGPEIVAQFPGTSAGIVAFDVWIMNQDRHCRNLGYHSTSKRLQVFDHSRALMPFGSQRAFADQHRRNLGIGNKHCLAPHLVDPLAFTQWIDRIQAVPQYYIVEVLKEAVNVGLRQHNVNYILDLLLERRTLLPQLLKENRNSFPALQFGLGSPLVWS